MTSSRIFADDAEDFDGAGSPGEIKLKGGILCGKSGALTGNLGRGKWVSVDYGIQSHRGTFE